MMTVKKEITSELKLRTGLVVVNLSFFIQVAHNHSTF